MSQPISWRLDVLIQLRTVPNCKLRLKMEQESAPHPISSESINLNSVKVALVSKLSMSKKQNRTLITSFFINSQQNEGSQLSNRLNISLSNGIQSSYAAIRNLSSDFQNSKTATMIKFIIACLETQICTYGLRWAGTKMRTLCLKKMRTFCLKKCGPCLKKCGPTV